MHTCPHCGYCPHCGRSDKPRWPYPWFPEGTPIWVAPYPGHPGIEVGDRPDLDRPWTHSTVTTTVEDTVSYL